ncbi:Zinc finger protein [Sarcoptes scabiei]|uniref:Zinc finger protein n=1 Tax=Sarcoptes scabiei TaxID=52283 RepID=A0A834VHU9_SARSC|nr:Zinc finger protein [Sarcoptes scabiei]
MERKDDVNFELTKQIEQNQLNLSGIDANNFFKLQINQENFAQNNDILIKPTGTILLKSDQNFLNTDEDQASHEEDSRNPCLVDAQRISCENVLNNFTSSFSLEPQKNLSSLQSTNVITSSMFENGYDVENQSKSIGNPDPDSTIRKSDRLKNKNTLRPMSHTFCDQNDSEMNGIILEKGLCDNELLVNDCHKDQTPNMIDFQPLKRKKLTRIRQTKSNTFKSEEIDRLKALFYRLYTHHSILNRLNQILISMNNTIVKELFSSISGNSDSANVSISNFLDSISSSSLNGDFLKNFTDSLQIIDSVLREKKIIEESIDEDVDLKSLERPINQLFQRSKKFPLSQVILPDAKVDNHEGKSTLCNSDSIRFKKLSSTSSKSKRLARANPSKEQNDVDEDKQVNRPCPFPHCHYESKRLWALNEHINLTHTGIRQFGCKVEDCPATFFCSSELDNHMKKLHTEEASKEFMNCTWPGCNALFKSKLGLRTHIQVHKGENLTACDWPGCNYLAKNKRQHENHLRKHTGDRPFICDFPGCFSKFRTNDSLRHHKKSHSEYRPFRCDWPGCESNFKTNRGLTIHRALHTGEKLFKCDWVDCDFASERKYHVDVHIFNKHTGVKPYPCTWSGCESSFLRNDKLQNHLKIHRQEKPFKCIHPTCEKHFVEKGNMMKHFNNVHKR